MVGYYEASESVTRHGARRVGVEWALGVGGWGWYDLLMNMLILLFALLTANLTGQPVHFTDCMKYADDVSYVAPATDMPNACIDLESGELSIAFDE
jgi:hypothetical protein